MPNHPIDLSILVPVYGSEDLLPQLHSRLTKVLSQLARNYEIVFINDCSPDNAWSLLNRIAATDRHVVAVALRKNAGYDNALMAGLSFVKGKYVVIMDDDLQHAPEDVEQLLAEIEKGYDVVYANFARKQQASLKNFGSWLNGKLAEFIVDKPKDIDISSFKVIRLEIAREMIAYKGPFPYIDGLIFNITTAIGQAWLPHHKRPLGDGNHSLLRSLGIVLNFCTTYSVLPLRIATYTGFAISFFAFCFSMFLVVWKLWFGINVEGWGSIMLAIAFMGGIQLLSLGVLGEYIGRTYMNINRQPQYVIKQVLSPSEKIGLPNSGS